MPNKGKWMSLFNITKPKEYEKLSHTLQALNYCIKELFEIIGQLIAANCILSNTWNQSVSSYSDTIFKSNLI